jgi:hypothetical protein
MKKLIIFYYILFIVFLFSCEPKCEDLDTKCNDAPPTDELCDTPYGSWFYNKNKGKCEFIRYNSCYMYGFDTKEECEEKCDCR